MAFTDMLRRVLFREGAGVEEAVPDNPPPLPTRTGFEFGISPQGLNEHNQGVGQSTQSDRRSQLTQLYEAYLACPWSWAPINAISRTITAGGLISDWDSDDGEGDDPVPEKPAEVLAMERLFAYCNPNEDIRQLTRNVVTDLLVFGDAFIEVSWIGDQPVALYNLDAPTMFPIADEHGQVTGYVQLTDFSQRAEFEPRDVIHISLDAPRSGVFGVSPTQAAIGPITAWLFAAATGKEMFRKGLPPLVHVDFPAGASQPEINKWTAQYAQRNVGPRNIGTPIVTKGNATAHEMASGRVADVESFLSQKRDEILAVYGTPPAKVGVIESGNLGGGTGETQHRTFMINTCQPLAEIILEKLNFFIAKRGFGIVGWHLKFGDVDLRDSKVVEEIRDMRLRNGSWTLNKYRTEIGEPSVDGGDEAVLVDKQNIVVWRDMDAMSKAMVAGHAKGSDLEPDEPQSGKPMTMSKAPPPPAPILMHPAGVPGAPGAAGAVKPGVVPAAPAAKPAAAVKPATPADPKAKTESWAGRHAAYRARLAEALRSLPQVEETDDHADDHADAA